MGRIAIRQAFWLCLVPCGCTSVPLPNEPDPLVESIVAQAGSSKKQDSRTLKNVEMVLREVPPQTPLAEARSIMERHGFSCWGGVRDTQGTCLYCTAYQRGEEGTTNRITVKLFYDNQAVTDAEVTVEYRVWAVVPRWNLFSSSPAPKS
jgi:hypothetical protein